MNDTPARGPKGPKTHLALVEKWKDVPDGTSVVVTKDDGSELKTKKRSIPWMLGASSSTPGHTAVMMVEGISGGYGLWRIRLDEVGSKKECLCGPDGIDSKCVHIGDGIRNPSPDPSCNCYACDEARGGPKVQHIVRKEARGQV